MMEYGFTYTITNKETHTVTNKEFICECDSCENALNMLSAEYQKFKRDYIIGDIIMRYRKRTFNEDRVTVKVPEWGNTESDVNFKSIIANRQAEVQQEKELQAKRLENKDIRDKYINKFSKIYDELDVGRLSIEDSMEEAFDLLVPQSGAADSVAGECVRAMMKILFRDYNDGDLFYSGYGIDTCGSPVAYLIDTMGDKISNMFEKIALRELTDSEYTSALNNISKFVMHEIMSNIDNYFVKNNDDMYNHDGEWIRDEWEPREEWDVDVSGRIEDHIDAGHIDWSDVEGWLSNIVQDDLPANSELNTWARGAFTIVTNPEGYETLEHYFDRWAEQYADELDNDYPFDDDEDDEDDEEDEEDEDSENESLHKLKFESIIRNRIRRH